MSNVFLLLLILSTIGIWFYSKKQQNKKHKLLAIILAVVSFVGVGLTSPNNSKESEEKTFQKQDSNKSSFQFNNDSAKEFALYFKENAYIIDSGNEVEFIVGSDKSTISVRLGEAWAEENISRKIYISNELKKEKDRILEEWLKTNDESATIQNNNLVLVVTVSDSDNTIIAQEIDGEMKIINN
ncbi:hypothetical protein [Streptococcus pluranimalium]